MDNNRLGNIINAGVLATSLVIATETPTYAAMFELEMNKNFEKPHEIAQGNVPDYLKRSSTFSFWDTQIRIGIDIDEDDYPEAEVIDVPVVKKMVFQFKKPVKLTFS
jgi:hypothetical protein